MNFTGGKFALGYRHTYIEVSIFIITSVGAIKLLCVDNRTYLYTFIHVMKKK